MAPPCLAAPQRVRLYDGPLPTVSRAPSTHDDALFTFCCSCFFIFLFFFFLRLIYWLCPFTTRFRRARVSESARRFSRSRFRDSRDARERPARERNRIRDSFAYLASRKKKWQKYPSQRKKSLATDREEEEREARKEISIGHAQEPDRNFSPIINMNFLTSIEYERSVVIWFKSCEN